MRRVTRVVAALAALAVVSSVRPAAADTLLTGSIGRTFGGDVDKGHLSYGALWASSARARWASRSKGRTRPTSSGTRRPPAPTTSPR